jgi:hypothetical protein
MFDLIKALLALRLAVMAILVGAALVLLTVWSLSHGAAGVGVAVLAAVFVCATIAAATVHRGMREH